MRRAKNLLGAIALVMATVIALVLTGATGAAGQGGTTAGGGRPDPKPGIEQKVNDFVTQMTTRREAAAAPALADWQITDDGAAPASAASSA